MTLPAFLRVCIPVVGLLCFSFLGTAAAEDFECMHHLVQPPLGTLPVASRAAHSMDASAATEQLNSPIRIYVDYSPLDDRELVCSSADRSHKKILKGSSSETAECKEWNVMTREKKQLIMELVPKAIAYLNRTLLVTKEDVHISNGGKLKTSCGVAPQVSEDKDVSADLYLMIGASVLTPAFTNTLAYAYSCAKATSQRPNVGVVNFNAKHILQNNSYSIVDTAVHEITHVLGFTSENLNAKMSNNNSRTVDSPLVLAAAKSFFNCDKYSGIPVENDGPVGSKDNHWERSIVPDELMCAAGGDRFSNITLSFLEDLGYYKRSSDPFQQPMATGKGAGCAWSRPCGKDSSKSEKGVEWFVADTTTPQCTLDFRGIGVAQSAAPFADKCYFLQPYNDRRCSVPKDTPADLAPFLFTFDTNSRCIQSDMSTSKEKLSTDLRCFSVRCPGGGRRVEIRVQEDWYACPFSGESEKVTLPPDTGVKGEMTCPVAADFCDESINVGSRLLEEKPVTTAPLPSVDGNLVLAAGITLNGTKWSEFMDHELKRIDIANSIRVDLANIFMTNSLYIRVRRMSVVEDGHFNMLFGLVANNETGVNPDRAVDVLKAIVNDPSKMNYTNIGYRNNFYVPEDDSGDDDPSNKQATNNDQIAVTEYTVQGITAISLCGTTLSAKNCLILISLLVIILGLLATLITMYCICCRNPFKYPPAIPAKQAPEEKYGPY